MNDNEKKALDILRNSKLQKRPIKPEESKWILEACIDSESTLSLLLSLGWVRRLGSGYAISQGYNDHAMLELWLTEIESNKDKSGSSVENTISGLGASRQQKKRLLSLLKGRGIIRRLPSNSHVFA